MTDLTFHHLQSYLARLDILIHRQVQRMQRARAQTPPPQNVFAAISFSAEQAYDLLQRPFGLVNTEADEEEGVNEEEYAQALAQINQQITDQVVAAEAQGELLPLVHLAATFALDDFAFNALLICLAPDLDLRYEKLYGYLLDDMTRRRPTINLILDLLCLPGPQRLTYLAYFDSEAPLCKHHLVDRIAEPGIHQPPLLNQALVADPGVMAWLLGQYQPHSSLREQITFTATPIADQVLLTLEQQAALSQAPSQAVVVFCGRDDLAQQVASHFLAAQWQRPLLEVDLAAAVKTGMPHTEAVVRTLRDARLLDAVVLLRGWDGCLEEGAPSAGLLNTICTHPGPVILASRAKWRPGQAARTRQLYWLELGMPDHGQRARVLTHFLAAMGDQEAVEPAMVASQFVLTTGQLRDLATTARDMATQANRPLQTADLFAAAREHANPRLSELAHKLTPRYAWADLILPADQQAKLHEFVGKVYGRPLVLKVWGVGEKLAPSDGVSALFAGPPGTGKTMAAEVIAQALKLDIYKIDLSSMVSKYIGETEKNLERIFSEAESSNAILFFDEADAIFGKRSEVRDAHDRYANIEVSYLLQRIERYDGVTILATNLRANLDEAFTRRFDTIIDFPEPESEDRLRIWEALIKTTKVPHIGLDFTYMARTFKLAGGNIRNILVNAAYLAATKNADGEQVITMAELLHSTERELQKMGRLVEYDDFENSSPLFRDEYDDYNGRLVERRGR